MASARISMKIHQYELHIFANKANQNVAVGYAVYEVRAMRKRVKNFQRDSIASRNVVSLWCHRVNIFRVSTKNADNSAAHIKKFCGANSATDGPYEIA